MNIARIIKKYSLVYDMIKLIVKTLGITTINIDGKTKNHGVFPQASLTVLSLVASINTSSESPSVKDNRLVNMVKI